jgi:hypothetical protein
MPDRAAHDDVDPLHRDSAARGRVAVHDEQTAVPARPGGLARIAVDNDDPRHHVLGQARARVSVHPHGRALVHAGAVVADVTLDLDLDVRIEAARDRMCAVRVEDAPATLARSLVREVVQLLVQLAQGRHGEVDNLDRGRRGGMAVQPGRGVHTFARSQA